jgi:hypothetical protein
VSKIRRYGQRKQYRHVQFNRRPGSGGERVTSTMDPVERSGELKAELIEFSRKPRYKQVDRDLLRASEVLRRALGRKSFDWQRDGEKPMRQRKRSFFERAPQPRILPISTRLAPYFSSS